MKIVTPQQMREIDRRTIESIGIPGMVLMENAASKVVEELMKDFGNVCGKHLLVVAGKGNNGGDAFSAARQLYGKGAKVAVFLTGKREGIKGDAAVNLSILNNMGIEVKEINDHRDLEAFSHELRVADLVVDGILGTGFKGKTEGIIETVINMINASGKYVISIDVPSGLDSESGKAPGACVKASKTVTFGLPKIGMVIHPGIRYTGELVVADIGIPSCVIESMDIKTVLTDEHYVSKLLPPRFPDSHKGSYGKVLIISGSTGMTGAGCLSAGAALRSGAGLVYIGVPASLAPIYGASVTEAIVVPLKESMPGTLSQDCIAGLSARLKTVDAAAVGPGLSVNDEMVKLIEHIIENASIPLVLDADALNCISRDINILKKLKADAVITPHPGEMARLMGISTEEVQNNRINIARDFAARWKVVTVLKGSRTVIAGADGRIFINPTGNPGMSTAGTGDVLTGIIAGLIAQGMKCLDAAVAGVYIHGLAGDRAAKVMGEHGLIAGDLVRELPYAIKEIIDL